MIDQKMIYKVNLVKIALISNLLRKQLDQMNQGPRIVCLHLESVK